MLENVLKEAKQDAGHLSALRREIHRHPELAGREYETAKRIEHELDALGIGHSRVGETGVLGTLQGDRPGPVIALRADIDALPILEETGEEYSSEIDGVMHACGHDAHITCLLGAAKLLRGRMDSLSGEIRLIFQPAEETGGGAPDFVEAGVLESVERVFGLHVAPDLPMGTVGIKPGRNNAAVDRFLIRIHGRSAHVSTPQLGADALYAAGQLVVALQGLVSRRSAPVEPLVLGVGKLSAGTTYNAVAEYAELEGTTRTVSETVRMELRARIEETAHNIAALSGASAAVVWDGVCSALVNDPAACAEIQPAAEKLGLTVKTDRPLSLGGDNFSEYLLHARGCYAYLGTADPGLPNTLAGIHNGHFDLNETVLPYGAAFYAAAALTWLQR